MAISAQLDGPPGGLAELRSDPIFFSQFLTLTLPPIDAVESADQTKEKKARELAYMPPSVGTPSALKELPTLTAWVNKESGKSFLDDLKTNLDNLDDVSGTCNGGRRHVDADLLPLPPSNLLIDGKLPAYPPASRFSKGRSATSNDASYCALVVHH
jgi:hypothetical protein